MSYEILYPGLLLAEVANEARIGPALLAGKRVTLTAGIFNPDGMPIESNGMPAHRFDVHKLVGFATATDQKMHGYVYFSGSEHFFATRLRLFTIKVAKGPFQIRISGPVDHDHRWLDANGCSPRIQSAVNIVQSGFLAPGRERNGAFYQPVRAVSSGNDWHCEGQEEEKQAHIPFFSCRAMSHLKMSAMLFDVSPLTALGGPAPGAVILVAVGFGIGFVSAIFGVGGGFFITPFLHSVVHLPAVLASATSLGQIPFMSLSGTLGYLRERLIDRRSLTFFLLGSIPTAQIVVYAMALFQQSQLATEPWIGQLTLSDLLLLLSFSVFIGMQGLYNLRKAGQYGKAESIDLQRWKFTGTGEAAALLAAGVLAGCFSALLGIGGGFFSFPVFVYICGLSPASAVASGLFAVFVTSFLSVAGHIYHDQIYFAISLMLAAGAIPGAYLGARRAVKVAPLTLLRAMGLMQLGIVVVYLAVKLTYAR